MGDPATSRRRPNLKEEVATYLRDQILSGRLRPSEKINQDEVAAELGVSKLPVREALIALETEGLIESVARRGAFVADLTVQDMRDHYAIYGLLSGLAARRAATRLSDRNLDDLQALAERIEKSADPTEQELLNLRFHQTINRAGASRRLASVLRLLGNHLPRDFFEFAAGWPERGHEDHRRIMRALRLRDEEAAGREMEQHLRASGDAAIQTLRDRGFWDS